MHPHNLPTHSCVHACTPCVKQMSAPTLINASVHAHAHLQTEAHHHSQSLPPLTADLKSEANAVGAAGAGAKRSNNESPYVTLSKLDSFDDAGVVQGRNPRRSIDEPPREPAWT